MTRQAQVVYQTRRAGGGVVWVHRPRGGWRTITFESGPTDLAKLLGLSRVLGKLGAATTTVLPVGRLLAPQTVPGAGVAFPALPRPGPAPASPNAP